MEISHINDELWVKFRYDAEIVAAIRKIGGGIWHPENKVWIFPIGKFKALVELKQQFTGKNRPVHKPLLYTSKAPSQQVPKYTSNVNPKYEEAVKKLTNRLSDRLVLKGYSPKTIESYTAHLARFLYHSELNHDADAINNYLLFLLEDKDCSHSYVNQAVNAIKQHLKSIGEYRDNEIIQIQRPKKQYKLPKVLGKTEVTKLFNVTENLKHKTALMMGYSCGMRVGEVAHIRLADIDYSRNVIYVRQGKVEKTESYHSQRRLLNNFQVISNAIDLTNTYLRIQTVQVLSLSVRCKRYFKSVARKPISLKMSLFTV